MTPRLPIAAVVLLLGSGALAARPAPPDAQALADAHDAWAQGDYVTALNGYIALLNGPGGEAFLEPIALQTGELYRAAELTSDGRAPRFSPDGRHIAYETGLEVSRRTRVVRGDGSLAVVADLPGVSATFAPDGSAVAYLKIVETPELVAAAKAVDDAPLAGQNRNAIVQALNYQVLRSTTIVVRDLASGQERELAAPGLLKTGLAFGADSRTLYFLGGQESDETRNDIYAVAEGRPAARIGDADGLKGVPQIDATGAALLYVVSNQNPFRKPQPPGGGGPGGGGGGGGGQGQRPPSFGIVDVASGRTRTVEGSAPALSADGRTLAYLVRSGAETRLMIGAPLDTATAVKTTTDRIDAPALSPDGRRVAYQLMTLHDWEIYFADRDGKNEVRLTKDIQHDVLPRFLAHDRLIAVVGEARHRRSFLYDLNTRQAQRLFHNNTVRTIAPEYQWAPNLAGTRLLVGAERDGDTVSPARGVYVLDLGQKIAKADLLARLRDNLASESALRAFAQKAYAAIAADVRKVVDRASVSRVYSYEKALFDFDSKHISRPGNALAAEYLFNTYKSFGYEPEYQTFEQRNALGGKTSNVIATLRGTVNPELVYVVSSHYDSVAAGPGADDDTSGTAALLEAARVLAGHPMPATIVFASFTGEEAGLLGSREYVRRAVESKTQIVGALNNDMIGWSNDQRLDNTIRYSNPGIRDIQHGAAMLFTKLITYDALYFKSTDAAAYYDAYGDIVGGIGSYPVLSNPHYHQSHDFLEFENHQLITETSKTTTATLMLLASSPSRIKDVTVQRSGSGLSVTWTPSPEKGIASYIVAFGPPSAPMDKRITVTGPRATLPALPAGSIVAVKAVNARGLEGWDWARATVGSAPGR
jgi:hypothetical protein